MAFESLPPSVNFWKQVSSFKDAPKRHASLIGLLDGDNKLVSDWSTKWDEAVKANRTQTEDTDDKPAKDDQLSELATKLFNGIIGKGKLASQLSALKSQDLKALFKQIEALLASMPKESDNEKA